jgi:D-sedoheptulose 7-phosphate isomerase
MVRDYFAEHIALAQIVSGELVDQIEAVGELLVSTLKVGKKIMLCGNGGSAADAQHIATEITGRYLRERKGLPAIALTTDTSALTAIGNDFGFDQIFARQILALATGGDCVVGISTSGNSPNVIQALETARSFQCSTVGLLGRDGGRLRDVAENIIVVPSEDTPLIQEMHITIGHILCKMIDDFFAES